MANVGLVDEVTNKFCRENESALGIFLDLSKAFDTINLEILLYKLRHCCFKVFLNGSKVI